MTKHEAKNWRARLLISSFGFRVCFVIRHSDFVISLLVDLTMGKLPKLAHISKWKCPAVEAIFRPSGP
jgi:hypothetical protein